MDMSEFYVTSFCNHAHRLSDGKPINHECYIIPPRLLKMEMNCGDWEKVREAWGNWADGKRTTHKGIK